MLMMFKPYTSLSSYNTDRLNCLTTISSEFKRKEPVENNNICITKKAILTQRKTILTSETEY